MNTKQIKYNIYPMKNRVKVYGVTFSSLRVFTFCKQQKMKCDWNEGIICGIGSGFW